MFENCSVMIIKNTDDICRLELDAQTQEEICESFSKAQENLLSEKTRVVFDGSYKPHTDEFLAIENFRLSGEIMDAIRNPIGVLPYEKIDGEFPEIKAIFVGERVQMEDTEEFHVAFQRFRKEQYISTKWYNLFFDENTFFQEKRFGISISDSVDCFYSNGELQFLSFYFARQVFDLSDYYRSATDQELGAFVANGNLLLEDSQAFESMANTWIRRKIAMINDSKVLEDYSAAEIKRRAKSVGVEIETENKKIKIPNDKDKIKIILGFLDEEAYKGPFSQNTYLANSKRQIR